MVPTVGPYQEQVRHVRGGDEENDGYGSKQNPELCANGPYDLILFRDGAPCWDSEDYRELGDFWKSLDPLCRWGGDFRNPDGGHFSIAHQGRA